MTVATLVLHFPDMAAASLIANGTNPVDHVPLLSQAPRLRPPPLLIETGSYAHKPVGFGSVKTHTLSLDQCSSPKERRDTLISLINHPKILSQLLQHLDWQDWFALISTCNALRQLFHSPALKDAILSHYVPEYRACLQHRDFRRYQDVHVTLYNLKLLRESPLPAYACPYSIGQQHVSTLTTGTSTSISDARSICTFQAGAR
jgi:hypothetical protein